MLVVNHLSLDLTNSAQQWSVDRFGDDSRLINMRNNKCLDVSEGGDAGIGLQVPAALLD